MSDGTLNFPERLTHPDTPTTGRVKLYTFNDGGGNKEPYYKLDDGSENTLKGDQGDQGIQGIQGPQGIQGIQGPVGPMNVEGVADEQATVTLPNTTTKTVIYSDTFNVSATGNCMLIVSLAIKPHAANNDYEFDIDLGGTILSPVMAEEGKDSSNAESHWRSFTFPLGSIPSGNIVCSLRFSKEIAGGTTQLKGYSAFLIRYS